MRNNHDVLHPSLTAFDALLASLPVGAARRRQLGMVRQELDAALENGWLPAGARRSLQCLLEDATLRSYVRIAATGALRSRLVNGERPPTALATNTARHDCLALIREAAGLPPLRLEDPTPVELHPVPSVEQLSALRRRLGDDVGGSCRRGMCGSSPCWLWCSTRERERAS
ncbi:hypothetical protein ABZ769_11105 [Streptomyces olivoreticuli]